MATSQSVPASMSGFYPADVVYDRTHAEGLTMRERMLAVSSNRDDPDLARDSERARRLTHQLNTMDPNDGPGQHACGRELLGRFGEDSHIRRRFIATTVQTFIGARTFANFV